MPTLPRVPQVDDHFGVAISGLTADARSLLK
jgi:20S proteasome alpha/beta subunit